MRYLIAFFALFTSGLVFAQSLPFTLPAELNTQYGPIAPLCFLRFVEDGEQTQGN